MPGKFGLRGGIARIRSGTLWLETVSEEPFHGPDPAQARPAQILKRNQEEARADRALLLAAAENGWKISIMLEECALPYNVIPVNLSKGEQFKSEFLSITPDNRMPVMVGPRRAGRPFDLNLRSGAIRDATRVASIHATRRGRVVADQGTGHQPVPTPQAVARARAGPSRPSIARYIFGSKRHDRRSPMLLVVK